VSKLKQKEPPAGARTAPLLGYEPVATPELVSFARHAITAALLGAGVVLAALLHLHDRTPKLGPGRWTLIGFVVALSLLPPVTRFLFGALEKIHHPTSRAARRGAVVVGVAAAVYFVLTAVGQDRDLFAKTHDDQSYLIQMQMLARGRLWMMQHDLADFFDTFYVLVRPRYASLYFPGAALMYVPTVWLHLPTWLMPAMVAGGIVGLFYRLVTELVNGVSGLLAALLLTSLSWFRVYSILLTSHLPMLLLGLLLILAWLRWRRRRRWAWALAMGVFAGWGAITRPADALCFALPVGVGVLLDLWRRPDGKQTDAGEVRRDDAGTAPPARPLGAFALTAAMLLAGAAPFLAIQLVFNKGVTGSYLRTPYQLYLERDQPHTSLGFYEYDPRVRPQSPLPQKQDLYELFYAPYVRKHRPGNLPSVWAREYLPMIAGTTLPAAALLAFVPLGLLGLRDRRRAVFCAVLLPFLAVYAVNTFFLEHYALVVAPAVLLLVLLGARALEAAWPRWRPQIASAFAAGIIALCISVLPELNGLWGKKYAVSDETFPSPMMRLMHQYLSSPDLPSCVILFRYTRPPDHVVEWINREPVFNTGVAWPDDAHVIRAHDLGPERNREIFEYYAKRQPERLFYRWDWTTGQSEELGTAAELAAHAATQPSR
jgi:dolichyl-phosphate-mannose-protein mannosyltransferase